MTQKRPIQSVICPSCRVLERLDPGPSFSYLDMWAHVSRVHQAKGCQKHNLNEWLFDPMWDEHTPRTLRADIKMRLVWHPDGYHMTVPAVWDKDRVDAYFAATRQRKGRRNCK